jgi:3-methyladenine DNA glycosylase AlkD
VQAEDVLARLRAMGDPAAVRGRARFGLPEEGALGVSLPRLRRLAREIGRDTRLANDLWKSGVHEARLLATIVADPADATRAQVERWLRDVASWDLCDGLALNLVDKTPWAYEAAAAWARREEEWVKRAGLATIAGLAWHDRSATDTKLRPLLALAEDAAYDERNHVKKAASWALRQAAKRRPALAKDALAAARRLAASESRAARWVASDVRRDIERRA